MIDPQTIYEVGQIALTIIGGATILLNVIAPLTKTKLDNKALRFLKRALEMVSLNRVDGEVVISVKSDTKE
jgi:hypothetical protein